MARPTQAHGLKLDATDPARRHGQPVLSDGLLSDSCPASLPQGKADNQILGVVEALQTARAARGGAGVQDINMRVGRALGLAAEDYQNDKTLEDGDLLYSGAWPCPGLLDKAGKNVESWQSGVHMYYRVGGPVVAR